MLVGNAGTGKTVLVGDKFASLDPDEIMVANVPFNYYTSSAMLQNVLEKPLEKKAGRNYGPPGSKKLVYFIDDMNMPEVGELHVFHHHIRSLQAFLLSRTYESFSENLSLTSTRRISSMYNC